MRFAVTLIRHRGRPLDPAVLRGRAPFVGDLRIEEFRDSTLLRYVRTARLLDVARPRVAGVLAELYEPVIVAMTASAFTLSGFERVGEQAYAQSWLVRVPAAAGGPLAPGQA